MLLAADPIRCSRIESVGVGLHGDGKKFCAVAFDNEIVRDAGEDDVTQAKNLTTVTLGAVRAISSY